MDDNKEFSMETRDVSPAHFLIKIESYSLLSENGIRKYESREFEAGDYKWRLIIYPDGHESEDEGKYVSVYLAMSGTSSLPVDWEVNVIFSIFLYNQILDNYLCFRGKVQRYHAMKSERGFTKMISKKSLTDGSNGYLVEDSCVFGAEVFVIKSQRVIECVSMLKVITSPSPSCKREWKISEFSKLKDVWTSEIFKAGNNQWRIKLYPNGINSEKDRSISIFLECVDSKSFAVHEKVKADLCMLIKNKLDSTLCSKKTSHWFTSSEGDWGYRSFLPIADMRDTMKIIDDCCFLEVEVSVQDVVRDAPNQKY